MARVHPTAIIAAGATLAEDVVVGPYCIVGPDVVARPAFRLHAHVAIDGRTTIGERTRIFPFAAIGFEPQDLKYKGEPSSLVIGRDNTIREHVTINTGTEGGGMVTRIGDHCLLMVGAHVAHDCRIGDHVIMANNATLAGHVVVEDYALLGGSECGAPVCPHRPARDDRRHVRGRTRRDPVWAGDRQPGAPHRAQHYRDAARRLWSRRYPGAAGRLSGPVRFRRHAERAGRETAERFGGIGPVDDSSRSSAPISSRAICQPKGAA